MPKGTAAAQFDYLRDPDAIYRASFAAVRDATDVSSLPAPCRPLAVRLVHACGMPEIVGDLRFSEGAVEAGRAALRGGAPVIVDASMVGAGITRARLPAANRVLCTVGEPQVPGLAAAAQTTRSAAAVELWRPHLAGAVVAIGNAPTALYRLLEVLAEGAPPPALICAFPVGFIGAAESKDALIAHAGDVPYITLTGRLGGSAMAAAALNALAGDTP